jgi:hypothetical protein
MNLTEDVVSTSIVKKSFSSSTLVMVYSWFAVIMSGAVGIVRVVGSQGASRLCILYNLTRPKLPFLVFGDPTTGVMTVRVDSTHNWGEKPWD